jgi:hypothetical protein
MSSTHEHQESKMKASLVATIVGAICLVLLSMPAHALATRTWVSGVGLDSNPCSRTAPCLTFAGAISQTSPGGEINCLDPGGFGTVTISFAITIKCDPNSDGGILASGGANGINIAAGANDVVYLEGLDINGIGSGLTGISFTSGMALHVSNCLIHGFTADGINFAPSSNAALLVVQDSKVVDNPAGGIRLAPTIGFQAHATITNTHMDRNRFGLRVQDYGFATVFNSTAAYNINNGILAATTSAGAIVDVSHSLITGNGVNGIAASGNQASITLFEVSITRNGSAGIFATSGGTVYGTNPVTNLNTDSGVPNGGAIALH